MMIDTIETELKLRCQSMRYDFRKFQKTRVEELLSFKYMSVFFFKTSEYNLIVDKP